MSQARGLTVRAAALTGLAALCRSYGVDAAPLLRRAGLPANAEATPDLRLPVTAVNLAFELAGQACGRDDFGLRLSELRGFANLGPISLLARDEPTVGAALAAISAYLPLHNDALAITRERFGDVVVLRSTVLAPGPKAQATDIAVAMQHRILRQLTGPAWEAEEVCLSRPRPVDPAKFRQVLGPHVRFDADFDGIVVRAELLERPNPMAEAALRPYASQMLRLADPGIGESTSERVRRVLALLLSSGRCTAGHVAAQLGMSRRTLTRALEAEGTRFLALLDAERAEVAQRHLAGRARSIGQIAELLGFSSPAAFSTWFRGHFGMSPREWRKQGG
ncbi:AraC family transcriptional regulator [Novosphingobium sp.]|uniref:AraC family transcriptional regulator n=1 Tax=Novosphingobium sp. TaxID=1874826 RepID=UPI0035B085A6